MGAGDGAGVHRPSKHLLTLELAHRTSLISLRRAL
jgi:hypothetical protein